MIRRFSSRSLTGMVRYEDAVGNREARLHVLRDPQASAAYRTRFLIGRGGRRRPGRGGAGSTASCKRPVVEAASSSAIRSLGSGNSLQDARGQGDHGPDKLERTTHGDPHDPEREQEKPDQRVEYQGQNRQRPAEHEQDAPQQELKHASPSVAAPGVSETAGGLDDRPATRSPGTGYPSVVSLFFACCSSPAKNALYSPRARSTSRCSTNRVVGAAMLVAPIGSDLAADNRPNAVGFQQLADHVGLGHERETGQFGQFDGIRLGRRHRTRPARAGHLPVRRRSRNTGRRRRGIRPHNSGNRACPPPSCPPLFQFNYYHIRRAKWVRLRRFVLRNDRSRVWRRGPYSGGAKTRRWRRVG